MALRRLRLEAAVFLFFPVSCLLSAPFPSDSIVYLPHHMYNRQEQELKTRMVLETSQYTIDPLSRKSVGLHFVMCWAVRDFANQVIGTESSLAFAETQSLRDSTLILQPQPAPSLCSSSHGAPWVGIISTMKANKNQLRRSRKKAQKAEVRFPRYHRMTGC